MSRKALRISVVLLLSAVAILRGPIAFVHAEVSSEVDQSGSSDSGDAVGGQVVGVSSSGDTSIDSTNRSEDVDVTTGDSSGSNTHEGTVTTQGPIDLLQTFIEITGSDEDATREEVIEAMRDSLGLEEDAPDEAIVEAAEGSGQFSSAEIEALAAFIRGDEFVGGSGDLSASLFQSADVGSGDAVVGQAVGVVTTLGATADLVLSNESLDTDADTGDTTFTNASDTTVVASPK